MPKPIAVGDMVSVIAVCCSAHDSALGVTGMVTRIEESTAPAMNIGCGCVVSGFSLWAHCTFHTLPDGRIPVAWLRRIDPPAFELPGVPQGAEVLRVWEDGKLIYDKEKP